MSRVLISGDRTKVRGPWQKMCGNCKSKVEFTINDLIKDRNGCWWHCPACGISHEYSTVTSNVVK